MKASREELTYMAAVAKGKATSSKQATLEQQRASKDVCSLIIGMAYGKPWPSKTMQEIRELSMEEKLYDGLVWFSSGKHCSENPALDDIIRSKPHLLVVDRSTDEKVNYLTKHLVSLALRQWHLQEFPFISKFRIDFETQLMKTTKCIPQ